MNNKILILDIETTGFLNQGGSIVEIGIVDLDLDTGKITEVFNSLVREDILTEDHQRDPLGWIFRNSNLRYEDILDAPSASHIYDIVQATLDEHPLGCTAYNNQFDFDFLRSRGIKIKALPCPMKLSTDICKIPSTNGYGGYKWPTAEEAYHYFFPNAEYVEKHRGLDDARHEAEIVYRLYQDGVFAVEKNDLQKTVDTVLSQMQTLTVKTDQQYIEAGEFLKKCKITAKTVEEHYSDELAAAQEKKKAAEAERKAVADKIKAFTDKLDAAERAVKRIMGDYQMEQEKRRRETEEARRREEEDRRLNTAIETGHEDVLDRPIAVVKEEAVKVSGTYTVDVWEFEIVNKAQINPDYLMPDEKAIGALVRSMKDRAQGVLGPGVCVTCRKDIRARV